MNRTSTVIAVILAAAACGSPRRTAPVPPPPDDAPVTAVTATDAAPAPPVDAAPRPRLVTSRSCEGLWQVTIPESRCQMAELAGTWNVPIVDGGDGLIVGEHEVDLVDAVNGYPDLEIVASDAGGCELVISAHNEERDPEIAVELRLELRDRGDQRSGTGAIAVRDPNTGAADCTETVEVGVIRFE
jgi:hypothetical protein